MATVTVSEYGSDNDSTTHFRTLNYAVNYLYRKYRSSSNRINIQKGTFELDLSSSFFSCSNGLTLYGDERNTVVYLTKTNASGYNEGNSKTILWAKFVIDISKLNNVAYPFMCTNYLNFQNMVIRGNCTLSSGNSYGVFSAYYNNINFNSCTDITDQSYLYSTYSNYRISLCHCYGAFFKNSYAKNMSIASTCKVGFNAKNKVSSLNYKILSSDGNDAYGVYNNSGCGSTYEWKYEANCLIKQGNYYYSILSKYYNKSSNNFDTIGTIADFSKGFDLNLLTMENNYNGNRFKPIIKFDNFQIAFSNNIDVKNLIIKGTSKNEIAELSNFNNLNNLESFKINGSGNIKILFKLSKKENDLYDLYYYDVNEKCFKETDIGSITSKGNTIEEINNIYFFEDKIKEKYNIQNMQILIWFYDINAVVQSIEINSLKEIEFILTDDFNIINRENKMFLKSKINSKEIIINYL